MSSPPNSSDSLIEAAVKILLEPDPFVKAKHTDMVVAWWRGGTVHVHPSPESASKQGAMISAPERPARSDDKVS